jgi:hypothetical protein
LAGKKISTLIAKHAWRAIFEVLLNFGKDAKSTHLKMSSFKKDTAREIDSLEKYTGMIERRIKDSKPFELYARLYTDISFQNKYIIIIFLRHPISLLVQFVINAVII